MISEYENGKDPAPGGADEHAPARAWVFFQIRSEAERLKAVEILFNQRYGGPWRSRVI